ncbi:hypothetical protein N0V84_005998 [Fusarium piperis]|uniref:Uncharacterized protein n=1 Tax=Fusarium piperis TaxID=1435070 RepID=A0A9W8WCQ8_9HYPO|nr:hypothetical protein N0V84_005998 [Fusarium piperis]
MCTFYSTGYMCRTCGSCVRFETTEEPCENSKSSNESKREKCVPNTVHKQEKVSEDQCEKCQAKKKNTKA